MVVDWDRDSSGLELDRRELVLGWRGWRLALSTKEARVSAPVVPHCLLSALLLPAPRVIRNCPAGPEAGRARVLVAAGPVFCRAIRTRRWCSIRSAPGHAASHICASAKPTSWAVCISRLTPCVQGAVPSDSLAGQFHMPQYSLSKAKLAALAADGWARVGIRGTQTAVVACSYQNPYLALSFSVPKM